MDKTLRLAALIAELEKMIAENTQRSVLGQSMAYGDADFATLAAAIRTLEVDDGTGAA